MKYNNTICDIPDDKIAIYFTDWDNDMNLILNLVRELDYLIRKQQFIPWSLLYTWNPSTNRYYRKSLCDIVNNLSDINANPLKYDNDENCGIKFKIMRTKNYYIAPTSKPYKLVIYFENNC